MQLCQFRGQLCPTSGLALKSLLRKMETLRLPWAAVLRALRFQVYVDRHARQGLDINKPPPPTYEKLFATVRLSGKRRTKLPPVQRMSLGCHVQIIILSTFTITITHVFSNAIHCITRAYIKQLWTVHARRDGGTITYRELRNASTRRTAIRKRLGTVCRLGILRR